MSGRLLGLGKKIVAIGKNYAKHIKEMGGPAPTEPVIFLKPTSSYVFEGSPIRLPKGIGEVHHEVELAVVIDRVARKVPADRAMDHVGGYALAIDLTARDIQARAKKAGLPWSVAKGYDGFCPISDIIPKARIPNPDDVEVWLDVNGQPRQRSSTADMIHKVAPLISYASHIFTLEPGDVILTGTPEGVGPISDGDTVKAGITGIVEVAFKVETDR